MAGEGKGKRLVQWQKGRVVVESRFDLNEAGHSFHIECGAKGGTITISGPSLNGTLRFPAGTKTPTVQSAALKIVKALMAAEQPESADDAPDGSEGGDEPQAEAGEGDTEPAPTEDDNGGFPPPADEAEAAPSRGRRNRGSAQADA